MPAAFPPTLAYFRTVPAQVITTRAVLKKTFPFHINASSATKPQIIQSVVLQPSQPVINVQLALYRNSVFPVGIHPAIQQVENQLAASEPRTSGLELDF